MKFSRLERLYQTPKKWKLAFQNCKLSNSFFKMQLQNCEFSKLQSSNSIFWVQSPLFFYQLVQLQVFKNLLKSPKLYKRSLTHFQKMSLALWFWALLKKNKKKEFCLVKWDKTNDFFSIGNMKADKTAKSFPTYRILIFEVW